jgi:hypothetical protein
MTSFIWVVISFYNSFGYNPETFFARSGAVMVILSIFVEFQLAKESHKMLHNNFFLKNKGYKTIPILPVRHSILSWFAHILVVLGTFVWGYGDLWYLKIA